MRKSKYTKEKLINIVAGSTSMGQVLDKLGLKRTGGNHTHIRYRIKQCKLNTDHFLGQGHNKEKPAYNRHTKKSLLQTIFIKNKKVSGSKLRQWLIKFNFKINKCGVCGLSNKWQDKSIILEVHHINSDHFDNRLKNLQLLCPNCHSQL